MKYSRTTRIFRGQLDVAPFMSVVLLLLMFVLLTGLVYTPGVRVELPVAAGSEGMPGSGKPTVRVAVDAAGQFFFENQPIAEAALREQLIARARASEDPLALVVEADINMRHETFERLAMIAREAGIREAWFATLPRLSEAETMVAPEP